MLSRLLRAALSGLACIGICISGGHAHEIVGNRFFPATLTIDDPGVNDELSVPTVSIFKTPDDPAVKQLSVSGEISKRITESFAVAVGPSWTHLYRPGGPNGVGASGFDNLETTFKYRFYKDPAREFIMSAGLSIEWGGSGARDIGAERFTVYTPTFYFGKGFGDLPSSVGWARPFAVTGQVGYAIPGSASHIVGGIDPDTGEQTFDTEFHPRILVWGGALQYSMPYLKSAVVDLGLPDFFNHLIPIVEASLQTPVGNTLSSGTVTTGTINPGFIWVGNYFQVGVEAMIPVNRESGRSVGVIAQLHLYLDDIFPRGIGQPIFGGPVAPRRPLFGN